MKNLLLIGAGQLGSRYLQSIAKENLYYNIVVVDYSEDSLNEAKKRWLIAGGNESLHKISWYKELPKEKIIQHCLNNLAKFKIPSEIAYVSELPRNATGKVLKRTLKEISGKHV